MPGKGLYTTIQVDLDGLWAIEQLLGNDVPLDPDPVFTLGLKRLVALFDDFGLKATFFVAARDLGSRDKTALLKELVARGHEIASHGIGHRYLSLLDQAQIKDEIIGSKASIEKALGVTVSGFKAPGFAASKDMVGALEDGGYSYDSSALGTSCALLMEFVSKIPYPKAAMMSSPSQPYTPSRNNIFRRGESGIIEIPVTTAPFIRTPAHFSYLVIGGRAYANMIRGLMRISSPEVINYLFHPLDLVDGSEVTMSSKVHGLNITADSKLCMAREMLAFLCKNRSVMTTRELSDTIKRNNRGISEAS